MQSFSRGQDDAAVGLLAEALRLDPSHAEAYEALGVILGRNERFHEAIDIFKRLEEVAPLEPMVHTNLSLFYMKIGDKEEAERQLAQATEKRFLGMDDARTNQEQAAAEELAKKFEDLSCTIAVKTAEGGKMFGSVGAAQIIDAVLVHIDEVVT